MRKGDSVEVIRIPGERSAPALLQLASSPHPDPTGRGDLVTEVSLAQSKFCLAVISPSVSSLDHLAIQLEEPYLLSAMSWNAWL